MILFLDFDGVLRRKQAPLYRLEAPLVDRLAALLRSYPEVRIVVSSSWKDAFTMDEIRKHFPEDMARRISGRIPTLAVVNSHPRFAEVKAYLRRAGVQEPWVAVDDDPLAFPASAPVVRVDATVGLDEVAVEALRRHFEAGRRQSPESRS